VAGAKGADGHYYVLEDRSLKASPERWASAVIDTYEANRADAVLGEDNYGGDMVESTIRAVAKDMGVTVNVRRVHATRGKAVRAEPIAALYERRLVHHVGTFPELEDEMCSWVPGDSHSPNRMDALVWVLTELSTAGKPNIRMIE
jgi:phage terminase large subunit-like protein